MKLVSRRDALKFHASVDSSDAAPNPNSLQVIAGSMLCRLHIWSEEEWAELPEQDRPVEFVHAPGLGWVGALPIEYLN